MDPKWVTSTLILDEKILQGCSDIERVLGRYEGFNGTRPEPELRRLNRIRTIQGSVAIEGNSLTLDQVTAVLSGKKVLAPEKDILEVQNAIRLYEALNEFNPLDYRSLLQGHRTLMQGLIPDAGKWRSKPIGILKNRTVVHLAPKAPFVQGMIKDLLEKIKKTKLSALIYSAVFHYEFEVIHPFSDGNGRIGRFWQHLMLSRFHPVFEYVPVESLIRNHQAEYYQALERSDRLESSNPFVEFSLKMIHSALQDLLGQMNRSQFSPESRLEFAREKLKEMEFSRKEYIQCFVKLSPLTASRDLLFGVNKKLLKRKGDKALARYRFPRNRA